MRRMKPSHGLSRRLPWVVFLISIGCLLLPHPARQAKARILLLLLLLDLFLQGLVISKNPVGRFFLHQLKSSWGFVTEFTEFDFYFRKKSAMAPQRKEGSGKDERADGSDPPLGSDAFEEFREIDGSRTQGTTRTPGGIAESLRDVLRGESDGDLLLERRDVESGVLQWLRALDLQVLGVLDSESKGPATGRRRCLCETARGGPVFATGTTIQWTCSSVDVCKFVLTESGEVVQEPCGVADENIDKVESPLIGDSEGGFLFLVRSLQVAAPPR